MRNLQNKMKKKWFLFHQKTKFLSEVIKLVKKKKYYDSYSSKKFGQLKTIKILKLL